MKLHAYLIIPILMLTAIQACKEDASNARQNSEDYREIPISDGVCSPSIENRKTVDAYENEKGEIQILQYSDGTQMVIVPERISEYMSNEIVQICNIPVPDNLGLLSHGDIVIFSGMLKEIYPTENMPGNPLKLTSIKVKIEKDPAQ